MNLAKVTKPLLAFVLLSLCAVLLARTAWGQDHIQLDLPQILNDVAYFDARGKVPNQVGEDTATPALASALKVGYSKVSIEKGHFLPGRDQVLLLTVEVQSGHAGGRFHNILCVIDPTSYKRISPIYFFRSDDAKRIVLPADDQTRILYVGAYRGQCEWFHDESRVLTFSAEAIQDVPIVQSLSLDPEAYYVEYREKEHGHFVFNLVHKAPAEGRAPAKGQGTPVCADVQYSSTQLTWDQSTWQLVLKK